MSNRRCNRSRIKEISNKTKGSVFGFSVSFKNKYRYNVLRHEVSVFYFHLCSGEAREHHLQKAPANFSPILVWLNFREIDAFYPNLSGPFRKVHLEIFF